ncbi:hypothetical protein NLM16_20715 [Bradyrhizobium brasilense]|uniref:hypothetical protein n=1 Tax=Bradyrhizobium brasilense TaxID=1419277 RepID=UPI00287752B2|nr:hypothetical protein [Bradyrhizobium brasilense]MCP3416521.1 hypothetical protein [Bradyrhizobium brasilense]
MNIEDVGACSQGDNDPQAHGLSPGSRARLLEEFFEIPRNDAARLDIGHPFVDRVLKRPKLPGLGQEVVSRLLLHVLRQQLQRFRGFLNG